MEELNRVSRAAEFYSIESEFDKKLVEYRFQTLKPLLHGDTCLEMGPGSGAMTTSLSNEFKRLDIVEGSKELLDEIPDLENSRKFCSLFEDFTPDCTYDSIIIEHVIEHVDNPQSLLKSAKNWLSPDGKIFVGVPNADSLHRQVAVEMGILEHTTELNQRDLDFGHRRVYTKQALIDEIQSAGLEVYDFKGVFLKPLSNGQIDKDWTPEMWEGFFKLGNNFPDICAEIMCICGN